MEEETEIESRDTFQLIRFSRAARELRDGT